MFVCEDVSCLAGFNSNHRFVESLFLYIVFLFLFVVFICLAACVNLYFH